MQPIHCSANRWVYPSDDLNSLRLMSYWSWSELTSYCLVKCLYCQGEKYPSTETAAQVEAAREAGAPVEVGLGEAAAVVNATAPVGAAILEEAAAPERTTKEVAAVVVTAPGARAAALTETAGERCYWQH